MLKKLPIMLFGISPIFCIFMLVFILLDMDYASSSLDILIS